MSCALDDDCANLWRILICFVLLGCDALFSEAATVTSDCVAKHSALFVSTAQINGGHCLTQVVGGCSRDGTKAISDGPKSTTQAVVDVPTV